MISKDTRYIFDTNILIKASNEFYHPDRSVTFWYELAPHIKTGRIAILKIVADELIWRSMKPEQRHLERFISRWSRIHIDPYVYDEHTNHQMFDNWQKINEFIRHGPYRPRAKSQWADPAKIADPWIIAAAMANPQCTVVTDEETQGPIARGDKLKALKIPFVCEHFSVPYTRSLCEVMQDLNIVADREIRDIEAIL